MTQTGPATTPQLPAGHVLRTVADAVVAKRHGDGSPLTISDLVAAYNAQIPEPAVEEPTEFGSIVRALWSSKKLLWFKAADNSWWSESGVATAWSQLRNPEVLRVGVGERKDMSTRIRERIVYLRDHTPLVVEQRAYEKAIKAVEELAP